MNIDQLIKIKNQLLDEMEKDLKKRSFSSREAMQEYSDSYQKAVMAFYVNAMEQIIDSEKIESPRKVA